MAEYLGSSFSNCEVKEGELSFQDLSSSLRKGPVLFGELTLLPSY